MIILRCWYPAEFKCSRKEIKIGYHPGTPFSSTEITRAPDKCRGDDTSLVQAAFANPSAILRPGQFARIVAVIDVVEDGLLVPQRCVQELQGKYSVFVVNEQNQVEYRSIEVGIPYGTGFLLVTSGLSPGEHLVYEGLQKVVSGTTVSPELKEIQIPEPEI